METYLTQISNYLLRQSWQIAILVVVVAVGSWLLRNKSAHIRYLLWLIILAKCLVPPVTTVPLAVLPQESVSESGLILPIDEPIMSTEIADTFDMESPPHSLTPAQRPSRPVASERTISLTVRQRLGAVWIAGMIIFALIAMIKALRTELWLRRRRKLLPAGLQDQIETIFSDLNLKTFPNIWLVEGIGQPFVWGLLRGGVYLPCDFINVNSVEQQRGILGHELSHILRFDAAVNILQLIAQAVFWFHPFVWWANKKIRAEREKCCDEVTIAGLGTKARDYSKAIVNILISEQQQVRPIPSIAVAGPVKNIEERIKTMLRPGKKFYKRPNFVAVVIVLLLALLTVPIGCMLTSREETETSTDFKEATSNPLHHAAKNGDIEQVKKLIANSADVNARDEQSQSPLHFAASGGHEEIARLLIAEGADINVNMVDDSWTPLLDAANSGHTKLVKLLLEKGAKVNVGDKYGYTPLYYAIWRDNEESVRMLIAAGADVNKGPKQDCPPLFHAVWQRQQGIIKALIDAGADVNAERGTEEGWIPLYYALQEADADIAGLFVGTGVKVPVLHNAVLEGDLEKLRQLVESGMDVDTRDEQGWTPAYWALSAGQKDIFEYLLSEGADINARTIRGLTLLHQASKAGITEIVRQLIAKGADVNVKNRSGTAPLQFAASKGHEDVVKLLVAKGANVNAISNTGGHALGDAASAGHEEVVKLLIASGAEVNLKGQIRLIAQFRGTALHAAVFSGRSTIVDLLIANGADVNINGINGTPLHSAARCRPTVKQNTCAEIIKKLLAKGADVNTKDPQLGRTPLHRAANRGRLKAAELFIAAGADVNAKDRIGFTPLWYAKDKDRTKIIELLSRHGAVESLHDVVWSGDIEEVKQLISKGADVNVRTEGWLIAPLHIAAGEGHTEICELLIAEGAKVNVKSGELDIGNVRDSGGTPLHGACSGGHKEVAELLLAHGADVNNKTRNNITPLDLARREGHQKIAKLLLKQGAKEGISIRDRFENARLISSGTWLEGSFQYRTDEEWFAIDVEEDKSYLIYYDDFLGTGKYTADIETYLYKDIVDDLKSKHCLFTNRHNVYQEPIKFTSDYEGKLYLRLISDNPQNTTFAIKYEKEE